MLDIGGELLLKTLICIMSDTTAVNTGIHRGAVTRIANHCNQNFGHDVMTLECLYHCIELLLGDVITAFDGDTKSPETLVENAVFNLIHTLDKKVHMIPSKLIVHCSDGLIKPTEMSKHLLSEFLDQTASKPVSKKSIRDDQACILVLSCATYI